MSDTTSPPVQAGMPCPRCRVDLVMSERQGIEIDYCPKCRGVWLDRGELDKIIDRAATEPAAAPPPAPPTPGPDPRTEQAGFPAYPPAPNQYAQPAYPPAGYQRGYSAGSPDSPDYRGGHDPRYGDPRYGQRRKRESFLGNLFDF